ncbi:MAG TPA: segregation/condensation protein A [Deltaproteobacteria bacterium]|nr:segregation/condensation protein A [Deltaproteobacteria bacterium]
MLKLVESNAGAVAPMISGDRQPPALFPNPANPLEVKLPIFEGPLDLLLHLIRRHEVAVAEVKLSELTASYLDYLNWMESIDLDVAGEYLDIAATLILIKSRELLPKPPPEEFLEDENPEELLRQRLLEYQSFKEVAFALGDLDVLGRDVFSRPEQDTESGKVAPQEAWEEVSVYNLMEAFQRVMERRPRITTHVIEPETLRLEDRIGQLIEQFRRQPRWRFEELLDLGQPKGWVILTFLGVLEMVRIRMIRVVQVEDFSEIHCLTCEEFEQQVRVWLGVEDDLTFVENRKLSA